MQPHNRKIVRRALGLEDNPEPMPAGVAALVDRYEQMMARVTQRSGLTVETQVLLALLGEIVALRKDSRDGQENVDPATLAWKDLRAYAKKRGVSADGSREEILERLAKAGE